MDIIVKSRHTDVTERFKRQVDSKLTKKISKLDPKVMRVDVEVSEERNPRQSNRRERVELTIRSRGPVIRAEAAAGDRFTAFDRALDKLESRLRKASDRRKVHHGNHAPARLASVAPAPPLPRPMTSATPDDARHDSAGADAAADAGRNGAASAGDDETLVPIPMDGDGPLVVREKCHRAAPMSVDQALHEMELVGHDFYLFRDDQSGHPCVVYWRRGWDYGLIRLVEE